MNDYPVYLEEIGYDRRIVTLTGGDMPFPPMAVGREQRRKMTYYPGNNRASAQVLGIREDPIRFRGWLKDRSWGEDGYAWNMMEWIQDLLDQGRRCRLGFAKFIRVGIVSGARFDIRTIHDIGYEIEFEVLGRDEEYPASIVDPGDRTTPSTENLEAGLEEFDGRVDAAPLDVNDSLLDTMQNYVDEFTEVVSDITGYMEDAAAAADEFTNIIRRAVASAASIQSGVANLRNSLDASIYSVTSSFDRGTSLLKMKGWVKAIRGDSRELSKEARELEDDLESLYRWTPAKFHRVALQDTLQSLAVKYYRDASDWRKIYQANEILLEGSTDLIIGMLLEIPR